MINLLVFQAGEDAEATFKAGLAAHERLAESSLAGSWTVIAPRSGGAQRWAPPFTSLDVNGLQPEAGYFLVVLADVRDEPAASSAVAATLEGA